MKFGNLYLDTNILRSLNFRAQEDPRLSNLKYKLGILDFKLHLPKVVLDELQVFYRSQIRQKLNNFKNELKKINMLVKSAINLNIDEAEIEKEVMGNLQDNLRMAEINIMDDCLDNIKIHDLVNMAVNKIKPFRDEDRGFKDAIILASIVNHCKKTPDAEHIFVTENKSDFDSKDVQEFIKKENVNLKIFYSIEEATKYLDGFINNLVKTFLKNRKDKLKAFLISEQNKIMTYIREISEGEGFSVYFLTGGDFMSSVKTINDIEFIDILNPTADFLEGVEEGQVSLTFNVKLRFYLSVERWIYEETPKFKLGTSSTIGYALASGGKTKFEEIIRDKEVILKGKVHVKEIDKEDSFFNLTLEEMVESGSSFLGQSILGRIR